MGKTAMIVACPVSNGDCDHGGGGGDGDNGNCDYGGDGDVGDSDMGIVTKAVMVVMVVVLTEVIIVIPCL